MNWLEILDEIVRVCLIPMLGILVTAFVKWVQARKQEIIDKSENELVEKYVTLLAQTISDCVIATNQTYVEELKDKNMFDEAAQKEALQKTYNTVMTILSDEAVEYLETIYGDLHEYIITKIEKEVNLNKIWNK